MRNHGARLQSVARAFHRAIFAVLMLTGPQALFAQGLSRFERVRLEAEAANRPFITTETQCMTAPARDARYTYVFTLKRWRRTGLSEAVAFEISETRRDAYRYGTILGTRKSPLIDLDQIQDVLSFASTARPTSKSENAKTATQMTLPGGAVFRYREGSNAMDLGSITALTDSRLQAVKGLLQKALDLGSGTSCNF